MLGSILAPHPLRPDWILESHLAQKVDLDSIKRSVINTATASGDNDTSKRSENTAIIADENHLFEGSVKIDNFNTAVVVEEVVSISKEDLDKATRVLEAASLREEKAELEHKEKISADQFQTAIIAGLVERGS